MKFNLPFEAYCSLISFVSSFSPCLIYLFVRDRSDLSFLPTVAQFCAISTVSTTISVFVLHQILIVRCHSPVKIRSSSPWAIFSVALRAGALGCVFAIGNFILSDSSNDHSTFRPFGFYLCILSFFHWSEYFATAISSAETLSLDSFLLNHSMEYWAAAGLSWLEFVVEWYFFPSLKTYTIVTWFGVILCIVGETFRKTAMLTAGRNFTHLIQYQKRTQHQLITHGIYSLFRHPSYVGWFWWSVGTQVTLCNPICTAIYAFVSWRFFNDRIYHEEITLINFFGEEYVEYQKRVPTGLPGIAGFQPSY